jgi:hypothetical protein
VAQVVEYLPSKREALSSNPITAQKENWHWNSTSPQNGYHKKTNTNGGLEDAGKEEPSHTVSGNVN